jgi:hypothetical protein
MCNRSRLARWLINSGDFVLALNPPTYSPGLATTARCRKAISMYESQKSSADQTGENYFGSDNCAPKGDCREGRTVSLNFRCP